MPLTTGLENPVPQVEQPVCGAMAVGQVGHVEQVPQLFTGAGAIAAYVIGTLYDSVR
jgi:hypothetical protein